MISLYQIRKKQVKPIALPDMSSLDAITRQLPEGYYSTFRTYDGCTRVIGLSAHLRRLPDIDASALRRRLLQLLEPFRHTDEEARVRVIETKQGRVYIALESLKLLPPVIYERGVRAETTSIQRHDPRIKSTAFISTSDQERKQIAKAGIFEALLAKHGKILEGMTSNFFYVVQVGNLSYLGTAQREILLGVTRTTVIRAARRKGIKVRYRPLEVRQLSAVKEAFITSSSRGIVPVIQVDHVRIGQGQVGAITKALMQAYADYVAAKAELIDPDHGI